MGNHDSYFMMLAIEEAKKGLYSTRPNPAVGCILVKDNQVVGVGHHPKAGQPHAEVFALEQAGERAKGATAYVTLEPCSHTGRTPPCANALIKAEVKKVVIAGLDPNPKVAGQGVNMLKNAGIEVRVGIAKEQAEQLNTGFLKAMRTQMPYVRLKIACSLDGKIAMASGESKWITGQLAREDVQALRARSSAIITGSQTVINDNPKLNVRSERLGISILEIPQPKVVILDRRKRLNIQSPCQVLQVPNTLLWHDDDLKQLLSILVKEHQCYDILVEAGASVASAFLQQNLVDELIIYQAPCFLGKDAQPMINLDLHSINEQLRFQLVSHETIGDDLKMVFKPF